MDEQISKLKRKWASSGSLAEHLTYRNGDNVCPDCLEESTYQLRRNPVQDTEKLRLLVSRIAGSEQPEDWVTDLVSGMSPLSLTRIFENIDETTEDLLAALERPQMDAFSDAYIKLVNLVRGSAEPDEELIPGHSAISLINNVLNPTPEQLAKIASLVNNAPPALPPAAPSVAISREERKKRRTSHYKMGDEEARKAFFEVCLDHLIETGSLKSEDIQQLADAWAASGIDVEVYRHYPDASHAANHRARNHRYNILKRLIKEGYAAPDPSTKPRDRIYRYTGQEKSEAYIVKVKETAPPKKVTKRRPAVMTPPTTVVEKEEIKSPIEQSSEEEFEPTYVWEGYVAPEAEATATAEGNLRGWTARRKPKVAIVGGEQLQRNIKGHQGWLEQYFDAIFIAVGSRGVTAAAKQVALHRPDLVIILSAFVQNDAISAITNKLPESAIVITRHQNKVLRSIALARAAAVERGNIPWFVDAYDRSHRTNPYWIGDYGWSDIF